MLNISQPSQNVIMVKRRYCVNKGEKEQEKIHRRFKSCNWETRSPFTPSNTLKTTTAMRRSSQLERTASAVV
jgi:hypothetical protein